LEILMMNLEEQAREQLTQHRRHGDHLHETMLTRAADESDRAEGAGEQARELLAETRHHNDHLHETMLTRAAEGH
jgi:hypothetical protein